MAVGLSYLQIEPIDPLRHLVLDFFKANCKIKQKLINIELKRNVIEQFGHKYNISHNQAYFWLNRKENQEIVFKQNGVHID